MDIWYTPERVMLYHMVDQRRMERQERRLARAKRDERRRRMLDSAEAVIEFVLGGILFYAVLFVAAL